MTEERFNYLFSDDFPLVVNEATVHVAKLIEEVYSHEQCACGGHLHCQLDDNNLEDRFFDAQSRRDIVEGMAWDEQDRPVPYAPEAMKSMLDCFDAMAPLTEEERVSAVRMGQAEIERGEVSK